MTAAGDRGGRTSGFWGYSLADIVVAAAALLLLIAYGPDLLRSSPVLLTAVAWPLGAVGLVGLVVLVVRGDGPARWAAGFLAWALVAALLADRPRLALDEGWGGDRGWVYLAAYLGCWAVGRRRGSRTATLVTGALVVGLLANVGVAWLQVTVPDGEGFVRLLEGRASGLTQNPVYLGALMSGGVALCASLAGRARRTPVWVAAAGGVALMAMAANLSGSRSGIAGAVLLGPLAAWAGGRDRARWARAAVVVAAIGVGLVAGSALLPDSGTARAASTGVDGGGIANRTEMWNAGVRAWTEHPVFGWGPNGFRDATEHRTTLRFVKAEGPRTVYSQAHNLVVEVLVTTGIGGLVLLGGFAWLAVRRARGPLAWYAAGVVVTWMLEPVVISGAPTALLALGLAMARPTASPPPHPAEPAEPVEANGPSEPDPAPAGRAGRVAVWSGSVVLAVLALAGSARLVAVDHLEYRVNDTLVLQQVEGGLTVDPATFVERVRLAEQARDLRPSDPAVVEAVADQRGQLAGLVKTPANRRRYLEATRAARRLAPARSDLWVKEGVAELSVGDGSQATRIRRARPLFLEAIERNPWSQPALRFLHMIDVETGRRADAARWARRLCQLGACPRRT